MGSADEGKLKATAVVLAGGESTRMGRNKAFLPLRGRTLIVVVVEALRMLFREVIVSANPGPEYASLGCRIVPDAIPGKGPLSGIHAGLAGAGYEHVFICACDMPNPSPSLIRMMHGRALRSGTVVPMSARGLEPLFAFYMKSSLGRVEELLSAGLFGVHLLPGMLGAEVVPYSEVAGIDPSGASFTNVNSPDEYERLIRDEIDFSGPGARIS